MTEGAFDAVVIGGSLAGSAAAFALARAGFRVALVERSRFPRAKVCGEFLSHEAFGVLARMGVLAGVRAAGAETIERFAVVSPAGRRAEGRLPAPVLSLSREALDTLCLEAARGAGATVVSPVTVTALSGDLASGFSVETTAGALRARAVVGAWGRYGPLDGRLGRPFFGTPARLFGFQRHLVEVDGEGRRFAGEVVLHAFPGGYLGLSRVEGGRLNLGALTTPEVAALAHHDLDRLLARLTAASPALADDLAALAPVGGVTLLSEPVHLGPRDPVARDVLLAGDAAAVVDPWTGTGMALALLGGEAAGTGLAPFLSGGISPRELARRHRESSRSLWGRRFLWCRLFRPFLVSARASRLVHPALAPAVRLVARLTRGGRQ